MECSMPPHVPDVSSACVGQNEDVMNLHVLPYIPSVEQQTDEMHHEFNSS